MQNDRDNPIKPVVVHEKDRPKEGSDENHLGDATWRTLLSGDTTPSLYMTCGIVEVGTWQGGKMITHQHPQSEIYHVLAGEGTVTIEGKDFHVQQGSTLFIPGGYGHGTRNNGKEPLKIFYVFAVDSFQEVEYILPKKEGMK